MTAPMPPVALLADLSALAADYRRIAERNRRQANERLTGAASTDDAATRYALAPETVRAAVYSKVAGDLEQVAEKARLHAKAAELREVVR